MTVKEKYLELRAKQDECVDDQKKEKDPYAPKIDPNLITEEDLVEIQLLDDFLLQHQRAFDQKK